MSAVCWALCEFSMMVRAISSMEDATSFTWPLCSAAPAAISSVAAEICAPALATASEALCDFRQGRPDRPRELVECPQQVPDLVLAVRGQSDVVRSALSMVCTT